MLISDYYKEQIRFLHKRDSNWGSAGAKHRDQVLLTCEQFNTKDVLDYGCGSGELAKSLPFSIKEYDPGIPGKDNTPEPADLVVCADVLEHIEPEYIDNVILDLKRCIKKVGFFKICTQSSTEFLPDGRNAHLLIRNWTWWLEKINPHFDMMGITMIPYVSLKGGHELNLFVLPIRG